MRGLTFKVTLERVNAAYSVEYYRDEVAPENLLGEMCIRDRFRE